MKTARSHHKYEVDTDHRLVTAIIFGKNNFESGKKKPEGRETEDKVVIELKQKKVVVRRKLSQTKKKISKKFFEQGSQLNNAIERREAHLITKELITEGTKNLTAKDKAQADHTKKKIIKSAAGTFKALVEKLIDLREKQFNASIPEIDEKNGCTKMVSLNEVTSCVSKRKTTKSSAPDVDMSEGFKQLDCSVIQETLIGYI